jgi:hypothetical protein
VLSDSDWGKHLSLLTLYDSERLVHRCTLSLRQVPKGAVAHPLKVSEVSHVLSVKRPLPVVVFTIDVSPSTDVFT